MNKKLIITEKQFEKLKELLNETPYDSMVKDIQVGDIVTITWKNSKNNFKVMDNTTGQIIMDNIDKGSANINYRYLMLFTSLNIDDLQLRRVHKINEKENLTDLKKWKPVTVNNITDIEIIRDGKVVDKVDPVTPEVAKQQQEKQQDSDESQDGSDIENNLAIIIDDLEEGNGLRLLFNTGEVVFCCVNKFNNMLVLEIDKERNSLMPTLNDWDSFLIDFNTKTDENQTLFELNKDIVSTSDNGNTFNLKFKVKSGDTTKEVVVSGIDGVGVLPNCVDDEVDDESKEPEFDKKAMYDMVLTDTRLRDAFYSQPTFWKSFVAVLKGEKPVGTGFITISKMLNNYNNKNLSKKIGEGWKNGGTVSFKPLAPVIISYTNSKEGSGNSTFQIGTLKSTDIDIRRFEMSTVAKVLLRPIDDGVNKDYHLRILVKQSTDKANIKICDVQIVHETHKNNFVIKGKQDNVNIEFLNSEGYTAQEETKKPEQKTN